jgi:hypothetical protein
MIGEGGQAGNAYQGLLLLFLALSRSAHQLNAFFIVNNKYHKD